MATSYALVIRRSTGRVASSLLVFFIRTGSSFEFETAEFAVRGLECSRAPRAQHADARADARARSVVGSGYRTRPSTRPRTARSARRPRRPAGLARGGLGAVPAPRGVPRRWVWVRGRARSSGTRDEPGPRPAAAPARTSAGAGKRSDRSAVSGAQHRGCPRAPPPPAAPVHLIRICHNK